MAQREGGDQRAMTERASTVASALAGGGFEGYWDDVDRELARYPAAPGFEILPLRKTPYATVYGVRLTSVGPYRIFG